MNESSMSNLPTEVISEIISMLPARGLVRSSVLSKQWKRFWKSNVNWRLTSSDYPCRRPGAAQEFREFINDVIVFHTGPGIQKMSINLVNHSVFHRSAVLWMDYLATNHPITELDLDIGGPVFTPDSLFSCTSLVILWLALHNAHIKIPEEVKLSNIKELSLQDVIFSESMDAQRLINGCRTLHKLEFNGCSGNGLYDIHLRIDLPDLRWYGFNSDSDYIYVCVAAMNQEKFTFRGRNLTIPEDVEFPLLKEASINELQYVEHYRRANRRVPTEQSANKMFRTVSSLKMAEKLSLGEWCTEYLSNIHPKVNHPTFENLRSLSIDFWPIEYHANAVLHLLKCSPHLQHLYAKTCPTTRCDVMELLCDEVHLHLKHIEMDSFTGSKVEMWLVERLVGCCPALTRLNIKFYSELEQPIRSAVRRGVRAIKKLSSTLIISVR